ncbi:unnamed protein product [Ceutorhynchus assimilis]|uniref:E3 ubiquitin-protein ligase listerin n=1 Tax=Ceutorhynchus assimilis TaxID=467358 RepID=A0A9N9MQN7_9CUCU|nr:unnamed protein product [Ceutorhynchus assimilis]
MGGKQNRTRNNVRPSNSGRSAAMLNSTLPQFTGFSGSNESTKLPSFSFNRADEFESSLDDNFQLVLKKVSKKDSTTKLKGLQEFADILEKADPPIIKTLLPIWPRYYSILAIHPDNRIREAAQNAHRVIVLKAKRDIAPYLKQLMAPWYTSQYDNYPAAAAAAIKAFKDTFSPEKLKEAILFCQQEILNYIHDNLVNQSAENMLSSSQLSSEEAEARYERVVISCLQGYAMYLKEANNEKINESLDLNNQIITNKKFWKFASSKVALVKSSWFQVISVILQKADYLLSKKETQTLLLTILNNLNDEEPTVLPHIWECLLLATSTEERWKCINIEQQFTPTIMSILKQAGNDNAALIYPNFLPLISNVPLLDEKKKQFYASFFENMSVGLKLKSVAGNAQSTNIIAKAYIECLQFLIRKNLDDVIFCKNLIKQLCKVLEWCMTKDAVSYSTIFYQTTSFVEYLQKNSNLKDIQVLVEFFTNLLQDSFYLSINKASNSIGAIAERQVEFLLLLKQKQEKPDEFYFNKVQNVAMKLMEVYLNYTEEKSSNELLPQVYILTEEFDSKLVFEILFKQLKTENYMEIYTKGLKNWLLSEQIYCSSVINLVFALLGNLEANDKEAVLNNLLEINQPNCITWSLLRAVSAPYKNDTVIQKWLKSDTISNLIISIAGKYINGEANEEMINVFKTSLESLISKDILNRIVEALSENLQQENLKIDSSLDLASDICEVIYTSTYKLTYGSKLLLTIFKLSCNLANEDLNVIWQKSLGTLLKCLEDKEREDLLEELFEIIEDVFSRMLIKGNVQLIDEILTELLETVYGNQENLTTWVVGYLSKKSERISGEIDVLGLCKVAKYVKEGLDIFHDELIIQKPFNAESLLSYYVNYFLKIQVLSTTLRDGNKIIDLVIDPVDNLVELFYSYLIADMFLENFGNVKYYRELHSFHTMYRQQINGIMKSINQNTVEEIDNQLTENLNLGWFWYQARTLFQQTLCELQDVSNLSCNPDNKDASSASTGITYYCNGKVKKTFVGDDDYMEEIFVTLFEEVDNVRKDNLAQFLYENSDISWECANKIIRSIRKCTMLMEKLKLTQRYWDFIVLSLVSWASNCFKARRQIHQYQYQAMLVSVSELYISVCKRIEKLKIEQPNSNFISEWEDILLEGIHADIARIWYFLADHFSKPSEDSIINLPILQSFVKVSDYLRHDLIFKGQENLPKWTKFFQHTLHTLLTNSQEILQLWGYSMLLTLLPGLVKLDEESVKTTTPHRNGLIFEQFKVKIDKIQDIVNSVLIDFRIGENSCTVEPSYDSYTYTLAYLLVWDVMLGLCQKASPELRFQYSDWLKDGSILNQFFTNIFKLMPIETLLHEIGDSKIHTDTFTTKPIDSTGSSRFYGSHMIENLACYLFKSAVEHFPALVRQWWTVLDIKTSQIVEKVTSLYVSPYICDAELDNVVQNQNAFKNLKVKVMPNVREIKAVYTVDEAQMELTITLPSNYPLGNPIIFCDRQISGANQKQWLLQIKKCVLHQNGKIWDGLSLWNSNLDRKFDGIEECYICYAVLHSGANQLPKLTCRTCKKKFHSVCLYKWFSTSNKSSCPICRNLF